MDSHQSHKLEEDSCILKEKHTFAKPHMVNTWPIHLSEILLILPMMSLTQQMLLAVYIPAEDKSLTLKVFSMLLMQPMGPRGDNHSLYIMLWFPSCTQNWNSMTGYGGIHAGNSHVGRILPKIAAFPWKPSPSHTHH